MRGEGDNNQYYFNVSGIKESYKCFEKMNRSKWKTICIGAEEGFS